MNGWNGGTALHNNPFVGDWWGWAGGWVGCLGTATAGKIPNNSFGSHFPESRIWGSKSMFIARGFEGKNCSRVPYIMQVYTCVRVGARKGKLLTIVAFPIFVRAALGRAGHLMLISDCSICLEVP